MKTKIRSLLVLALMSAPAAALGAAFDAQRCLPEGAADAKLYSNEFHWGYTLPEMIRAFAAIYPSPKRLPKRAYWNAEKGRLELPYLDSNGGAAALPQSFADAVVGHVEDAYAGNYVDAVFFPDMGHSHFLVPQALWDAKYSKYPVAKQAELYTAMFQEPALEVLYHTAEQLTTRKPDGAPVDDPRTQFRYRTRNIVGRNDGVRGLTVLQNPDSAANTVSEVPGYFWWGAGFNISANENGCFAAVVGGRTIRFDLSLFDLEPEPGTGDLKALGAPAGPRFGECESLAREKAAR